MSDFTLCDFDGPQWLILSENVPPLMYYTHFFVIITTFCLAWFVLMSGRNKLENRIFFYSLIPFWFWLIFNIILFASNRSDTIMLLWTLQILLEPLVYAGMLYLVYVMTMKKDMPFTQKMIILIIMLPVIVTTILTKTLVGFNLNSCLALESSYYAYYPYGVELLFIVWILALSLFGYKLVVEKKKKQELLYLSTGIISFLLLFSSGNIIGSLTENWNIAQIGLFGVPIFLILITYGIVKLQIFNIKLLGTQALVVVLVLLIGSQFFFVKTHTNFILTAITFLLVIVAGLLLIRSFKRSEERKEELQIMADRLAVSNDRLRELDNTKTEFISIASHQLRTPLTSIKGYCSLILEGMYGAVNPQMEEVIHRIIFSNDRLVNLVENLLNISRIESGRMEYNFEAHHIGSIISELYSSFAFAAQSKKLTLTLNLPEKLLPLLSLDKQKMQEVFSNLIDNAIKYTNQGSVVITVDQNPSNHKTRVTVKDSGIGISADEIPFLFTKFSRGKNVNQLHVNGTGLGLYVAKNIIEAHKGKIWIESEGAGKGTSFIVELG